MNKQKDRPVSLEFDSNRVDNKKFKARIIRPDMLVHKAQKEIQVQYYGCHYGHHMWQDVIDFYLVLYESEIQLISEVDQKVA